MSLTQIFVTAEGTRPACTLPLHWSIKDVIQLRMNIVQTRVTQFPKEPYDPHTSSFSGCHES